MINRFTKKRNRNKQKAEVAMYLRKLKDAPCQLCLVKYNPWQMQYDHIDHRTKTRNVSRCDTIGQLLKEVAKCRLLCANCHADVTYKNHTVYREVKALSKDLQLEFS